MVLRLGAKVCEVSTKTTYSFLDVKGFVATRLPKWTGEAAGKGDKRGGFGDRGSSCWDCGLGSVIVRAKG